MGIEENLSELLGPVVANLGVDLVDVEYLGSVLRVVVDQEGGVTTNTLAKINRLISPMLDEQDPIASRYTLEVSSPGVERKLKTVDHFERSIGETVSIKLVPTSDTRRVKGELVGVADSELTIAVSDIDGVELDEPQTRIIHHGDVLKARTVFNWGPTPKKGGSKNGKQKKNASKSKNASKKSKTSSTESKSKKQTNKQGSGITNPGTQDRGTL